MLNLKVEKRDILGKKVQELRRAGFIPAELYGHGIPNIHLRIPSKDFNQIYKEAGEHALISVEVDGISRPVLISYLSSHPTTGEILTVDLYQVRLDEKTKAHVPLEFIGKAPAVKDKNGVLVKNMDEIEVEALPADLPEKIRVDLGKLEELDQTIYVRDLPKTSKFDFTVDPEAAIVSVIAPRVEEEKEEPVRTEEVAVLGEEEKTSKETEEKEDETET